MRTAVYCRISDDRSGDAAGVGRQEQDCRELANRRGWDVTDRHVYVDNSRSAWKRERRRPGWDALLEAVKNRDVDAIVVYHGDRLIRQPRDLEDLLDLADAGVQLASPSGTRDLANPDDRFILRIEAAHACRSSDDTSRRTRRKHLELAQQGRPVGGTRPFGYQPDRVTVDAAEATIVQEAAGRVLAGESLWGICTDLNARGVAMPRGGRWSQTALRRILTAPRTAGYRSLHGDITAKGTWEPLLDEATWRRVRAVLDDPARRSQPFPARRYLLTGWLWCGRCGTRMVAQPRQNARRTYSCPVGPKGGCGLRIVAEPVDAWVVDAMCDVLDSPELAARHAHRAEPDDSGLVAAIAAEEAKLVEAADMWDSGEIDRGQLARLTQRSRARLEDVQRQLSRVTQQESADTLIGQGTTLQARWEAMTLDQQRAIIGRVLDRINVQPAATPRGRFDPSRIADHIAWRL